MSSLSEEEEEEGGGGGGGGGGGEKNFYSNESKSSLGAMKIPGDTLGYIIRDSNVDAVFLDTVKSLLSCFETGLKTDMDNMSNYWKNSIYELGTQALNEAFDMEPDLEKIITTFLEKIIDSILNGDDDYESKVGTTEST